MIKQLIGQYTDNGTFIHKLDSRLKIIFIVIFSMILIIINDYAKLVVATIFIVGMLFLSKLRLAHAIYAIKSVLFIYIFIIIMYFFFSRDKLINGLISLWKFTLLIFLGLLLTTTTTLKGLIQGIERILSPTRFLRLSPRNIALMLSITIRFIPAFFLYGQRVKDAQLSRLSNFKKLKGIKLFISKLMNRMIASADTLSDAIEARCYDVRKRHP